MNVISFSLWGSDPFYVQGAIENCKLAKTIYPDWKVWIYVNDTVPQYIIDKILDLNGHVIPMGGSDMSCWNSMWRFLPCTDPSVNSFISRDSDSRFTVRESNLVSEWLASPYEFHLIRDHEQHGLLVCAGMFGLKRGYISGIMEDKLKTYRTQCESTKNIRYQQLLNDNMKGIDQDFLGDCIYPYSNGNRLAHVSAGLFIDGDTRIEPALYNDFIGKPIEG